MSYQASSGLAWQGIGYGSQWYALPEVGLGADEYSLWYAVYDTQLHEVVVSGGTNDSPNNVMPALRITYPSPRYEVVGYPTHAQLDAYIAKLGTSSTVTAGGMSKSTKLAIGAAVLVGGYLLLKRKR